MTARSRALSVDDVGFFEGAEKLLEVWFRLDPRGEDGGAAGAGSGARSGLRVIAREKLEELLDLVHCKIISHCCNDVMDAYLLR